MASKAKRAVGVDIGGTGIKAGIVDLVGGVLASDRVKVRTPLGAQPSDVLEAVRTVLETLGVADDHDVPLGVAFPAIVKGGRTLSAANVSKDWIGFKAEKFFEKGLGRDIHFANDADVAGVAELRYGAAAGRDGLTILTTLGTGIGSAMLYNGVLVPNTELGHLQRAGEETDAEAFAAYSAMERENAELGGVGRPPAVVLQPRRVPVQPRPVHRRRRRVQARRPVPAAAGPEDADRSGRASQQRGHHRGGRPRARLNRPRNRGEWAGLYAGFCSGAKAPSTVIYLGDTLPCRSSGLPGDSAGRVIIPCLALLRARFTLRVASPRPRWSLTPPFHPYRNRSRGGLFSVALSRGSLRVGVTHRPALWSPDVPRCGKPRHAAVQPTHSRRRV